MTFVAELAHLSNKIYEMSICSLGAMGTEYVRDTELPSDIELIVSERKYITIENVHAA